MSIHNSIRTAALSDQKNQKLNFLPSDIVPEVYGQDNPINLVSYTPRSFWTSLTKNMSPGLGLGDAPLRT